MDSVNIRGIRCFRETQEAAIRPLTVLVGENSTGKTTFLASIRLAWDLAYFTLEPDWNEEPFRLGSYDDLASYRGGKAGRVKSIEIGFSTLFRRGIYSHESPSDEAGSISMVLTKSGAEPRISSCKISFPNQSFVLSFNQDGLVDKLVYSEDRKSWTLTVGAIPAFVRDFRGRGGLISSLGTLGLILDRELRVLRKSNPFEGAVPPKEAIARLITTLREFRRVGSEVRPLAFAPIRSTPQRTYDPIKDLRDVEGAHVPTVLAKMSAEKRDAWLKLKHDLDRFGDASGLWEHLEIKQFGRHASDPFQVRLKLAGPSRNLIDVGYGVSQIFPVVADLIMEQKRSRIFLLQQPEVHLHPRAQAELGSFLGALAADGNKRFVVETHSDFLIDRIRIDLRKKRFLTADKISILYFERRGHDSVIHQLNLDENANITNTPRGYRKFFLDEEKKFLGLD